MSITIAHHYSLELRLPSMESDRQHVCSVLQGVKILDPVNIVSLISTCSQWHPVFVWNINKLHHTMKEKHHLEVHHTGLVQNVFQTIKLKHHGHATLKTDIKTILSNLILLAVKNSRHQIKHTPEQHNNQEKWDRLTTWKYDAVWLVLVETGSDLQEKIPVSTLCIIWKNRKKKPNKMTFSWSRCELFFSFFWKALLI